ncbi:MAG TPA: GntR family transcriptional regulator, partial [Candidatus Tectomicrobia bacterium]|nr:GntR family transcriptional regulator [Candidatus Tectomicrobia bacterium]
MSKLTRLAPRRSLHEQAYEVIREFVLGGGIPPGGVVSASQIAHELGVSATPVKEALGRLAAQGLVQVLPQRGVRLAEATPADIADLYDFREGLEAMSLALAPRPFPAEALAQLAGLVAECERYVAAEDRRRYTQADIRFHEVLV